MPSLVRYLFFFSMCIGVPKTAFADQLLADLEELYSITEACTEKAEVALRWGMVLRQSPLQSPGKRLELEAIYKRALEPCAHPSMKAQALFELGIVAFGDNDYDSARGYFTRLLNSYSDDLLVVDALYWLGETLTEVGDLRAARNAYLGVARRSVGEMRGWGLFKGSRLSSNGKSSGLVNLIGLLNQSGSYSPKFRRAVADAFVADWSKASNRVRGAVRKSRAWQRLKSDDAALLTRSMGRYFIGTSNRYALKSLLASLKVVVTSGWEFERELWSGLAERNVDWLLWILSRDDLVMKALGPDQSEVSFSHLVEVFEIALARSNDDLSPLPISKFEELENWSGRASESQGYKVSALLKLFQLMTEHGLDEDNRLERLLEDLALGCLKERSQMTMCGQESLAVLLNIWNVNRSQLERMVEGSAAYVQWMKTWMELRRSIEGRRVVIQRLDELTSLIELAAVFQDTEARTSYISMIPKDYPDANCALVNSFEQVDSPDTSAELWRSTSNALAELGERGLGGCKKRALRLVDRLEVRLDLQNVDRETALGPLLEKHAERGGLALLLIEQWRRAVQDGEIDAAILQMEALLTGYGTEREVRAIATEWGEWLERKGDWLAAGNHYEVLAERGGLNVSFYALSKASRAYRLAGEQERAFAMMRQAQTSAINAMNPTGLSRVCDYWWKQWRGGSDTVANDVIQCHDVLLERSIGDQCRTLTRKFQTVTSPRFPMSQIGSSTFAVKDSDCAEARWLQFLANVRGQIASLLDYTLKDDATDRELSRYLQELERRRFQQQKAFAPFFKGTKRATDSLALAYWYGRFHEVLYERLMGLEDPSLGGTNSALWLAKLSKRGEPLRNVALSAYQKASSFRVRDRVHPLEAELQEALLRLEALSTQPALDYLPFPEGKAEP